MKKLLFLFSLFLMLSCSNSDDNTTSSNSDFHPPVWIQGTWNQEGSNGTSGVSFKFAANDFCMIAQSFKQCQQEFVNQYRQHGNAVTVIETITATNYTAEIKYFAGQSIIYSFRKLSNTSIEWTSVPGSVIIKQ
ncbi:hypothetical protein [Flavobacterium sp. GSP6]|uniref:hypothetical protein n=1 Tax=Flavobacterium sp. GSP6 TaxID=2497488 RepID=UPI000F8780A7|nr:hypothetical protein [Flavobacterium sp. GSP6]RTZ05702.1 hypothetical protein EKM03_07750 [Flavobacterium sp. GSP6]